MNDLSKLSLDMFLTLFRYVTIAYCLKIGVTDESVMNAYVGLVGAGITVLWGLQASGYFKRFVEWFQGAAKE